MTDQQHGVPKDLIAHHEDFLMRRETEFCFAKGKQASSVLMKRRQQQLMQTFQIPHPALPRRFLKSPAAHGLGQRESIVHGSGPYQHAGGRTVYPMYRMANFDLPALASLKLSTVHVLHAFRSRQRGRQILKESFTEKKSPELEEWCVCVCLHGCRRLSDR